MLLPWLILIPFIGGFLCWQTERFGVKVASSRMLPLVKSWDEAYAEAKKT